MTARAAAAAVALLPCLLSATLAGAAGPHDVRDLGVVSGFLQQAGADGAAVALRAFERDGRTFYLIVDPKTLITRLVPASSGRFDARTWPAVRAAIADSPYGRALADVGARKAPLQDAGLTHVRTRTPGIDLTVDLCPSRHPLDRRLFKALADDLGRDVRPVPVAIAVTGVWMEQYGQDLEWLLSLERAGTLSITWIDHSFHHHVNPSQPLRSNFLLEPGTDITAEVLDTERAMLERGLTPSVFFRFPGLVSSPQLFDRMLAFGLIPVGSDAWLAKNQRPTEGSIVLVHANGNEPLGVRRFLELLRAERDAIRQGHWQLFDLRATVAEGRPE